MVLPEVNLVYIQASDNREFKETTKAMATGRSPNKSFTRNEQCNGCAHAL